MTVGRTLALFDLDGTLIDSAPDIADALDRALLGAGIAAPGEALTRTYIGDGAAALVHRAICGDREGEAPPDTFERVYASFLSHYEANLFRRTRLYPGVIETLSGLQANGWALGCITNKPRRFTAPVLEAAGLATFFSIVVSGDSLTRRKPDPAPILHACASLGTATARTAMIGDSATDLTAAKRAGVAAVCVSYGYGGDIDLARSGADALIASMSELPAALDRALA